MKKYSEKDKEEICKSNFYFIGQKDTVTANARKTNSQARPDGYLYVLKLKGFDIYKIGVSANPRRRIRDIDSANPFGIDVLCVEFFKNVYNMEECIHDNLVDNVLRKEWFKIADCDIKEIIKEIKEMSSNGIYLKRL